MKLKVFVQPVSKYEILEKEVNRWIDLNSNIAIESKNALVFSPAGAKEEKIMLQIWYIDE